jgi:hypothetical protein
LRNIKESSCVFAGAFPFKAPLNENRDDLANTICGGTKAIEKSHKKITI